MDSKQFMRAIEDSMFLRVRDVARRLAVSRGTVYNLMYSGELLSIKVRGSRRIPAEALMVFIEDAMADERAVREERRAADGPPEDE